MMSKSLIAGTLLFTCTAIATNINADMADQMVEARHLLLDNREVGEAKIKEWSHFFTVGTDDVKSELHTLYSDMHSYRNDCTSSIEHAVTAIKLAKKTERLATQAYNQLTLAYCAEVAQNDTHDTKALMESAIDLATKVGDMDLMAIAYTQYGGMYTSMGDTLNGMKWLHKADALNQHIIRTANKANILAIIGSNYVYEGNESLAIEYYNNAISMIKDDTGIDSRFLLGYVYYDLASIYTKRENFELADRYVRDAMIIANELDDKNLIAILFTRLAGAAERQDELDDARMYMDSAIATGKDVMAGVFYADIYVKSALLASMQNDVTRAESDFEIAHKLYTKHKDDYGLRNYYWAAYTAYKELEEVHKAFGNLEQFVGIDRIMKSKRDEAAINELKTNLEIAKLEASNKELELNDEKQQKRLIITFASTIILMLAVVALMVRTLYHRRAKQRFKQMALTDDLTQIPNRRFFFDKLNRRTEAHEDTCIIIFDIDYFKQINDTLGHDVGDMVLKKVAKVAKNTVRDTDVVARFGGEEFVVLLANTQIHNAVVMAERIRKNISEYDFDIGHTVTASFGVASVDEDTPIEESIKAADIFMYEAKEGGRNRVASPLTSPLTSPLPNLVLN